MSVDRRPLLNETEDAEDMDTRITRALTGIKASLDKTASLSGYAFRDAITQAEQNLERVQPTWKNLRLEIRDLPPSSQKTYEAKLNAHKSEMDALALRIANLKNREVTSTQGMSASRMMYQASAIQDESLKSTERSKKMIQQSLEIGAATNEALKKQTEQLKSIGEDADTIQENLDQANKQLRAFMRRLATDKFIVCFLCLIFLAVIFVIAYSVTTGKSPFEGGGDSW
eukprot:TRINITY_DN2273_c0_g2_i1.p1 TRINITY_DN2273_c0_g2~~TRINITY_DN2273_c0_g2_i1.p1  ORF type:complete len:228 (-),score=59.34 TRINITY_DN2273_c0_g2_i1:86-769(-)